MKGWVSAAGKLARYEHIGWNGWPHSRCCAFHSGSSPRRGNSVASSSASWAGAARRAGVADLDGAVDVGGFDDQRRLDLQDVVVRSVRAEEDAPGLRALDDRRGELGGRLARRPVLDEDDTQEESK